LPFPTSSRIGKKSGSFYNFAHDASRHFNMDSQAPPLTVEQVESVCSMTGQFPISTFHKAKYF
jgi:hypothetical protein